MHHGPFPSDLLLYLKLVHLSGCADRETPWHLSSTCLDEILKNGDVLWQNAHMIESTFTNMYVWNGTAGGAAPRGCAHK
jgi:hypothetical protein